MASSKYRYVKPAGAPAQLLDFDVTKVHLNTPTDKNGNRKLSTPYYALNGVRIPLLVNVLAAKIVSASWLVRRFASRLFAQGPVMTATLCFVGVMMNG